MSEIKGAVRLFKELVTCAHSVRLHGFDKNCMLCMDDDTEERIELFFPNRELLQRVAEKLNDAPAVITSGAGFAWVADCDPDDGSTAFYLLGPVFLEDYSIGNVEYLLKLEALPAEKREAMRQTIESLPVIPLTHFHEYGLMLHFCLTGNKISISDYRYYDDGGALNNAERDLPDAHASWVMEQQLLRMVETGDVDFVQKASRLAAGVNLKSLGNGNHLRHLKNVTIVSTALFTRAAIRGGVSPDIAYSISDRYIRAIEATAGLAELTKINAEMQSRLVSLVNETRINSGISPRILKVSNFIASNPEENHSLTELAKLAGYSSAYLSKKFKSQMGMTLSEYINRVKVEKAKDLLTDGKLSIQYISETLGFNSFSYFCEVFKELAGISPGQYRSVPDKTSAPLE